MDDLVTASCVVPMATNPNHHCGWQLVTLCTDMLCVVLLDVTKHFHFGLFSSDCFRAPNCQKFSF